MYEHAEEFTLPIHVMPPEFLGDDAVPTRPFAKPTMNQLIAHELGVRRIEWARRLLVRFGFGLPEQR